MRPRPDATRPKFLASRPCWLRGQDLTSPILAVSSTAALHSWTLVRCLISFDMTLVPPTCGILWWSGLSTQNNENVLCDQQENVHLERSPWHVLQLLDCCKV